MTSAAQGASAGGGWDAYVAARDAAVRELRGRVLEIGAGYGANFTQLHPDVQWRGLEPSSRRRGVLEAAARRHGQTTPPLAAPAEDIPMADASVDAVLGTTVLCSVRDPARVLDEVARVLVPGGRVVLADHVAARPGTGSYRLQRMARPWSRLLDHGCDPLRDTERAVAASSLFVDSVERFEIPVIGRLRVPFVVIRAYSR